MCGCNTDIKLPTQVLKVAKVFQDKGELKSKQCEHLLFSSSRITAPRPSTPSILLEQSLNFLPYRLNNEHTVSFVALIGKLSCVMMDC